LSLVESSRKARVAKAAQRYRLACASTEDGRLQPDYDQRISFLPDLEVVEVDFSGFTFENSAQVHAFYDQLEIRITATRRKWFFLVNYLDCHIYPEAWITFANRGKKLNLEWSLGSVRYAARGEMRSEIMTRAEQENFDPNLFPSREAALTEIARLRGVRPPPKPATTLTRAECERRLMFLVEEQILEVDFSGFTFPDAATVNAFYDVIDFELWKSAARWYFMVNYNGTKVFPEAWVAFANRGKKVNLRHSLGTVRYEAEPETAGEIQRKAAAEKFNPNLCNSRDQALRRIAGMRAAAEGEAP
jgi:hypothetical protein